MHRKKSRLAACVSFLNIYGAIAHDVNVFGVNDVNICVLTFMDLCVVQAQRGRDYDPVHHINPSAPLVASHEATRFFVNVIKRLRGLMSYLRPSIEGVAAESRTSFSTSIRTAY